MRLDHIAYRVRDRKRTAQFFIDAIGYKLATEFDINFEDGSTAQCIVLEPPEKIVADMPFVCTGHLMGGIPLHDQKYHLAPEIFISDGSEGSIVGEWVKARSGIGGVHHMAYQVSSVEEKMKEWREKGYAEFTTEEPIRCPGLTQAFTRPSELTGIIIEFIEREKDGFCKDSVRDLMNSTKDLT